MTPEGWKQATIRDIVDPQRKVTYGIVQPGGKQPTGIPIIRGKDYSSGRVDDTDLYLVKPEIAAPYKRSTLKGDDILLSIVGYLGLVAIVPPHLQGANITQTTARIAIRPPHSPMFFLQQFQGPAFKRELRRYKKGSAQPGLNLKDVERMEVLIPPIPEQRKIAAILSSVDEVIEKTEAVIEQLRVVKKAMMQGLLTRGLPGRHTRFKQTEIGEIPENWEVARLDETFDILDRRRKPLNKAERSKMRGNIPYYGANGLVDHLDQWLFDEPLVLMAEDGGYFDEYETRHIAYLVDGKCWVNNHAHVLSAKPSFCREWLFYTLVHRDIRPYINSGTRTKLNQADLRRIPMPVPPIEEQEVIATRLAGIDSWLAAESAVVEALRASKAALMSVLLTGEVRVTPDKEAA